MGAEAAGRTLGLAQQKAKAKDRGYCHYSSATQSRGSSIASSFDSKEPGWYTGE